MSAQPVTPLNALDAQRAKAAELLEEGAWDDLRYGEPSEALMEAIGHALLYVGDALRESR